MRRDQDITVSKNNSQTDLVVVQDGDTTAEWLDLENVTGDDIVWQVAEGTVSGSFDESDVIYEAPSDNISVLTWGSTDAEWPARLTEGDDSVAEPPDSTLIIQVEVPPEATADWLVSPVNADTGNRTPELVRECKIQSPDDFALQRTAISVVQGDVTVLPSTDDGTGQP